MTQQIEVEKHFMKEHSDRQDHQHWPGDVQRVRDILGEKTWIGFDLDDTLHEYRVASGIATDRVLQRIAEPSGVELTDLQKSYRKVLRNTTANAFADGKSSFDYRKERFVAILNEFSIPVDNRLLDDLLQLYEDALTTSYQLKPGALELLATLKQQGKKIMVITEGPQDAQERAVKALGLSDHIDFMATTNRFGVSKTGGLFRAVLEYLNLSPEDMAYVGDSDERDMQPAISEGIFAIHYAEMQEVSLTALPIRINTFRQLQDILLHA